MKFTSIDINFQLQSINVNCKPSHFTVENSYPTRTDKYYQCTCSTVKNRTLEKIAVVTLKFEQCCFTTE